MHNIYNLWMKPGISVITAPIELVLIEIRRKLIHNTRADTIAKFGR